MADKRERGEVLTQRRILEVFKNEGSLPRGIEALLIEGFQRHQIIQLISEIIDKQAAFRTASVQFIGDLERLKDLGKFEEMKKRFAEGAQQFRDSGFDSEQVEELIQFIEEEIMPKENL